MSERNTGGDFSVADWLAATQGLLIVGNAPGEPTRSQSFTTTSDLRSVVDDLAERRSRIVTRTDAV